MNDEQRFKRTSNETGLLAVLAVADLMAEAFRASNKLRVCVSGGSADCEQNLRTTGQMGSSGRLLNLVEMANAVPSTSTQYMYESHLAVKHIICCLVEQVLYGKN